MEDKIKIMNCGCGGEAEVSGFENCDNSISIYVACSKCHTSTVSFTGEQAEENAIEVWNRAMGAKDINVPNKFATDTNVENKTAKFKQDGEFLRCGKCNRVVDSGYKYCPECGSRLEFE